MKRFLIAAVMLVCASPLFSQGINDVRINEIMVKNVDNYEDGYGKKIGWIELFNTGYSKVDLAGSYLTIKLGNADKTYRIPPGDPHTVMEPRGYLVFFCDGTDTKGTFHTNFTLDETGYLALLNASSSDAPIDVVEYSVEDQEPDISMGRIRDEEGNLAFAKLTRTTPGATNEIMSAVPQHELFRRMDPFGGLMAITAMCVVFSALALLFVLFHLIGRGMVYIAHRNIKSGQGEKELLSTSPKGNAFTGEEEIVAIAMAMDQYRNELHDRESTVVTINRVARVYSPWNSKIYGMRQTPNKK